MSRRFGRNQKRAMREKLASAENEARMLAELRNRLRIAYNDLRGELDEAKEIAGHLSVLFPAQTMEVKGEARDFVEVYETVPSPDQVSEAAQIKIQSLPVMLADIQPAYLRAAKHVMVSFGSGKWGYGLDNVDAMRMPHHVLAKRIAVPLADLIARELASGGIR